jgi:alkanesulfonate monooxygenase SsuD/methylene tetrahydromethanopterin reductase-like flavin-dependent oxidoreductase (luciferase family)
MRISKRTVVWMGGGSSAGRKKAGETASIYQSLGDY